MSTPTLTMPLPTGRTAAAFDDAALPDWLYRSEAFAEDLPSESLTTIEPAEADSRLPGALALLTLAMALVAAVATVPSLLPVA